MRTTTRTPVATIIRARDLRVGDLLCGDEGAAQVTEVTRVYEYRQTLYRVVTDDGARLYLFPAKRVEVLR